MKNMLHTKFNTPCFDRNLVNGADLVTFYKVQYLRDIKDYLKGFSVDDESFILFTFSDFKVRFWSLENNIDKKNLVIVAF